ncbi:MAG TPA: nitrate- and nitrite sensing domain-containing protein, partial [Albitalea sp.]|nr:nitrate- and nitrite sensing domain-containing protein [Albitalea sp.]
MKHWIANLRMWQKFALIGVLAIGMVTGPTVFMVKEHWALMDAARTEAAGMGPAGDVLRLVQLTQQHRGLTAAVLSGNEKSRPLREARQAEVAQALQKALASSARMGSSALSARGEAIQRDWQALAQQVNANGVAGPESFARHTALIVDQLSLLEGITDVSTLALDPEAGSYYLINAVLGELPKLSESMGQMRARGAALLAKGEATPIERAAMASLGDTIRAQARGARSGFDKSFAADVAVRSAIEKPLAAAADAVSGALKLADEGIVRPETLAMSS